MPETVKHWMSGDPVSVAPDASALEALERMQSHGIRHLPVVDGARQVVGVLSIDDLRAALPFDVSLRTPASGVQAESAREWCVGDLMTHAPMTLREGDALAVAAEKMAERRIGCLPIVDAKGRLAGILSETDLLHALASLLWTDRVRERRAAAPLPELERLLADLSHERDALMRKLDKYHALERDLATHASREPLDEGDSSADLTELHLTEALDALAIRRLRALDHALDRAAKGQLDRCDDCGGRIPLARLRALPGTSVCIACARAGERR
jgi:CBS domain-containing protein/RNA polymerase-binding transcription factor DksA